MKHTKRSSNEFICICRRTASQAASGAYPTVPVVVVAIDGPLLDDVVGIVVPVLTLVGAIGLVDFCLACRKAISEQ